MVFSERTLSNWFFAITASLTLRRMRAQAILLILCLWGVCAVDFSTSGLIDRAGSIKFQDFLQFYISARLIYQGRPDQLYDQQIASQTLRNIVQQPTRVILPTVYGPQVGLFFLPLSRQPFLLAASIWVAVSIVVYCACIVWLWKSCPNLYPYARDIALAAAAFPPFFHFFLRGQISVLLLVCFTGSFLAFHSAKDWLAGAALGFLVFKPQFLVAIPLMFLLAGTWKPLLGLLSSAVAQIGLTWIIFGTPVMRAYFETLLHVQRWIDISELGQAQAQMHSLRSFWLLLVPWPSAAFWLYICSAVVLLAIAVASWKSSGDLALRFSSLIFAAVLINPHLFVYDLLVLAPALLLTIDWAIGDEGHPLSATIKVLAYFAFLLPLLGPLTIWTHIQLSVPVFFAIQLSLWKILCEGRSEAGVQHMVVETQ